MTIITGDFIIFEGTMFDMFILREVMEETHKSYKVRNPRTLDTSTIRKSSVRKYRRFDSEESANTVLHELNKATSALKKKHKAQLADHFLQFGVR